MLTFILLKVLSLLISLEASILGNRFTEHTKNKLDEATREVLRRLGAADLTLSLEDQIKRACCLASQIRHKFPLGPIEESFWGLLQDETFLDRLVDFCLTFSDERRQSIASDLHARLTSVSQDTHDANKLTDFVEKALNTIENTVHTSQKMSGLLLMDGIRSLHTGIGSLRADHETISANMARDRQTFAQGQTEIIRGINALIAQVPGTTPLPSGVSYSATTYDTGMPELVRNYSPRETSVAAITSKFDVCSLITLHGPPLCGKTYLAVLTAKKRSTPVLWCSFRELTVDEACYRMDSILANLIGIPLSQDWHRVYSMAASHILKGSLLVFDDAPMAEVNPFVERASRLTRLATERGFNILTTMPAPPTESVLECLPDGTAGALAAPELLDEEAAEILQAHAAPSRILSLPFTSFLNDLARHNPALLSALAMYLRNRQWEVGEDSLRQLLAQEYQTGIDRLLLTRFVATTERADARELFYRLSLLGTDFLREDVLELAKVSPPVDHPLDRFEELRGLWVQESGQTTFSICPLFRPNLADNLHSDTRKQCHVALAGRLLAKGTLNPLEGLRVITHYLQADLYDVAGAVYVQMSISFLAHEEMVDDYGFLDIYAPLATNRNIRAGIRLVMVAQQMAHLARNGKPIGEKIALFETVLSETPSEDHVSILLAAMLAVSYASQQEPKFAHKLLKVAMENSKPITLPDGETFPPVEARPETMIWFSSLSFQTNEDFLDWIDLVSSLSDSHWQAFIESAPESWFRRSAMDRRWVQEGERAKDIQDWQSTLQAYQTAAEKLYAASCYELWVYAIRVQIAIHQDSFQDLGRAIALGQKALSECPDEACLRFLIKEWIGRQYVYAKKQEDAIPWFEEALGEDCDVHPEVLVDALICAADAFSTRSTEEPLSVLERAVAVAEGIETSGPLWTVRTLGELAIARYLHSNDPTTAFEPIERACRLLLQNRDDSETWKDLFIILAHIARYYSEMTRFGRPPESEPQGEEYAAPYRRLLLTTHSGRAELCTPEKERLLPVLMLIWGEAIGDIEIVEWWARFAVDTCLGTDDRLATAASVTSVVPSDILNGDLDHALTTMLIAAEQFAVLEVVNPDRNQKAPTPDALTFDLVPSERQKQTRVRAAMITADWLIVPSIIRLAHLVLLGSDETEGYKVKLHTLCQHAPWPDQLAGVGIEIESIITRSFEESVGYQILAEQADALDLSTQSIQKTLTMLGASVQEDAPVKDIARLQIPLLVNFSCGAKRALPQYERIILPFFQDFWLRTFARSRAVFLMPSLIAQEIEVALLLPVEQRGQALMRTICDGLGLKPDDGIKEWFNMTS